MLFIANFVLSDQILLKFVGLGANNWVRISAQFFSLSRRPNQNTSPRAKTWAKIEMNVCFHAFQIQDDLTLGPRKFNRRLDGQVRKKLPEQRSTSRILLPTSSGNLEFSISRIVNLVKLASELLSEITNTIFFAIDEKEGRLSSRVFIIRAASA